MTQIHFFNTIILAYLTYNVKCCDVKMAKIPLFYKAFWTTYNIACQRLDFYPTLLYTTFHYGNQKISWVDPERT